MVYFWFPAIFEVIATLIFSVYLWSKFDSELGMDALLLFVGAIPLIIGMIVGIVIVAVGYAIKRARANEIKAIEDGMNKFRSSGKGNEA